MSTHNQPVGLANTQISTGKFYAQKSPQFLHQFGGKIRKKILISGSSVDMKFESASSTGPQQPYSCTTNIIHK